MARIRKSENFSISTQNVIPQLAETPLDNLVMMIAAGASAIPIEDYTVNGKVITWDEVSAGYDLEVGDIVVVDYEYESGTSETPYDSGDPSANPTGISYTLTVVEENVFPKLIHIPISSTLVMSINNVVIVENVDWTRNGKNINWVAGYTLAVGTVISVSYRQTI